jgi:RNA polymerase sigma-70 factor (ECF subfamily)
VAPAATLPLAIGPALAGGSVTIAEAVEQSGTPARRATGTDPRARQGPRAAERRLVRAAQDGSEEALEVLFRRHWPLAHRAAYLVVRDGAAAEDIAQEAFLAAIRSLSRFDRRRPFGPWLHRIVVNRAIDHSRARKLRGEVGAEMEREAAAQDVADDPRSGGPFSEEVSEALASLEPERRAIVVLRYLLEFTPGEIAAALEIPRGTVNSRLRRALDQLALHLEEERDGS